jgi:hypothetical protein
MSNCMKFDFKVFLNNTTDSNTKNILEFLFNDKSLSFRLPDEEFFKTDGWDRLFIRYNGYPEFEKCFMNDDEQLFVSAVIENREERYDILKKFFAWLIPYIDMEKLENVIIGNYTCDSSFDFMKLKIDRERYLLIREIL